MEFWNRQLQEPAMPEEESGNWSDDDEIFVFRTIMNTSIPDVVFCSFLIQWFHFVCLPSTLINSFAFRLYNDIDTLSWKSSAWFFREVVFSQSIYGLFFSSFQCFYFNSLFNCYCFSTTIMILTDTMILKKKFFYFYFLQYFGKFFII